MFNSREQRGRTDIVDTIKVSAKSRSTAVAGAIAGVIRESRHADVQAIGAGAVNQAIKAVAIARSYLQQDQLDIYVIPTFAEVDINGEERTAVRLRVESRPLSEVPIGQDNGHDIVSAPDEPDAV
jgi:stage V sporulation protein S